MTMDRKPKHTWLLEIIGFRECLCKNDDDFFFIDGDADEDVDGRIWFSLLCTSTQGSYK